MGKQAIQPILYPVILTVPETIQAWKGRRQVQALSRLARAAARMSTRRHHRTLGSLRKNSDGVPLPSKGWYWSIAHKPLFVAGVVGERPIGIDIEPVQPRSRKLFKKIAHQEEWRLGNDDGWHLFYRFWTAKEAVLKAAGVGLKGLSNCRVVSLEGPNHLTIHFEGKVWPVCQSMKFDHLVAVTSMGGPVEWGWPSEVP